MAGIQSGGVYKLVNAKAENVVADLSGGDNESVIGYGWHGGDNQKVRRASSACMFVCVRLLTIVYSGVSRSSTKALAGSSRTSAPASSSPSPRTPATARRSSVLATPLSGMSARTYRTPLSGGEF